MRCENKTFLQNDPGFLQEISSTAVEVGLTKIRGFGDRQEGFGVWFLRLQSDRWKGVFLESSSWNAR